MPKKRFFKKSSSTSATSTENVSNPENKIEKIQLDNEITNEPAAAVTHTEAKEDHPSVSETLAQNENSDNNQLMRRSRLRKSIENQSKRTLFVIFLITVTLIALLVVYGPTLLIQMSLLAGNIRNGDSSDTKTQTETFVPSPRIDFQPSATNSARITITGETTNVDQVKLYVNDELADAGKPKDDTTFIFEDVRLKEGLNKIKTAAFIGNSMSAFSDVVEIKYLKEPPSLSIDEPQDGQTFSGGDRSVITVRGKTDPNVSVRINDFVPITRDDGSYSYSFPLQNSENKIKVVATDEAGNKTEKEIKVTYSP